MAAIYQNSTNFAAGLKELYKDDSDVMKNMVYKNNPLFALMPKDESLDGMGGKYRI